MQNCSNQVSLCTMDQRIEKALQTLNSLPVVFLDDMIRHSEYANARILFFSKSRDPYVYIRHEVSTSTGLSDNYVDLNNALAVLSEAQTYINKLSFFSRDSIKTKYAKSIDQNLKFFNPYLGFIKKVVSIHFELCENKRKCEEIEKARLVTVREDIRAKHPIMW